MQVPPSNRTILRQATGAGGRTPALLIDATCPLLSHAWDQRLYPNEQHFERYRRGGATAVAPTVGGLLGAAVTLRALARWQRLVRERADVRLVRNVHDIDACLADERLGLIFHFQGAEPFEDDVELVDAYAVLGLRVAQLTYNRRNRVGFGCEERSDEGLSDFGHRLIEKLNAAGIIVDCAHTGGRTTLDAIATSAHPVVISHANTFAIHPTVRNVTDEIIRAVAASGGVIGVNGFPPFVGASRRPELSDLIRHIEHVAQLVGPDHVGLGLDYFEGQHGIATEEEARRYFDSYTASSSWGDQYPPPPYHYPEGIDVPERLWELSDALARRGFREDEVRKVMGENWRRVYARVWDESWTASHPAAAGERA